MVRSSGGSTHLLDAQLPAKSLLGRTVFGRPRPVWTMVVTDLALALLCMVGGFQALVHPDGGGDPTVALLGVAYWLICAVALMWLGRRATMWLLNVLLAVSSVAIGVIAATRSDDIRASTVMVLYVLIVIWAATWLPRAQMWLQFAVIFAMMFAVVNWHHFSLDARATWVVLSVILLFLGLYINALVLDIHRQTVLDPLTGLLNRTGLDLMVESRSGDRLESLPRAVVVVDLDGFKQVNDRLGHHAGDELLREVGSVMRRQLRPSDAASRIGGDEFLILLPNTSGEEAAVVMSRLVKELPLGCSFGIAEWFPGRSFEESAKVADARMFEHKKRCVIEPR